jgi:ArsR family transcriptional regulator
MKDVDKERIIKTLSNCDSISNSREYYEEIMQLKQKFLENQELQKLNNILDAFGNPDRLLILNSLKTKDRCVCELEAILEKTQPAVSHHIKVLEKINLIRGWKKGKFTHYSLIEKTFKEFEMLWNNWCGNITNWFG